MDKTKEEILQEQYVKFTIDRGITSISTKNFPLAYQEPALSAMDVYAEQEARAFANFIANTKITGNMTMDKLWKKFK
jgi:hypothetical protein